MITNKIAKCLIFAGILDTVYLTWEHYVNIVPPCPVHSILGSFIDCGKVLHSSYANLFGIPLSLLGLLYFIFLLVIFKTKYFKYIIIFGLLFSLYLFFIQISVLHAICLYCTLSGMINLLLFMVTWSSKFFLIVRQKSFSQI